MKRNEILAFAAVLPFAAISATDSARALVDAVDPTTGAITLEGYGGHGLGKTFPGTSTPFGMVQLSPDTITGGDNGCGYSWHHRTIEGFSFFHMCGVGWYGDLGNFEVMPATGPRVLDREMAKSPFSHDREKAQCGYYSVKLDRYDTTVELAPAPRAGMMRFTFPSTAEVSRVQIDLARRIGQKRRRMQFSEQSVRVVGDSAVEGFMKCDHRDGGWGAGAGRADYRIFFRAEFERPFKTHGIADSEVVSEGAGSMTSSNLMFFAEFEGGGRFAMRAGFSHVDLEGARANLAHDLPKGFDFDAAVAAARESWADAFSCVDVEGGSASNRAVFASCLYRTLMDPREVSDADGRFSDFAGFARSNTTWRARTVFSGWDVFRSEFPLLTIVRPDVVSDSINSLSYVMARTGRRQLPRWDLYGCDSGCMVGHPAIAVAAEAYAKGIRTFDAELLFEQGRASLNDSGNFSPSRNGVVPGNLSETLEFAYDDWCLGELARLLGHEEEARLHFARSETYTNCWSAEVGWMRARTNGGDCRPGGWLDWKGREVHSGQGTVESNPWQQGWFVPHDVYGLMELMGGREKFASELESFFEATRKDFLWNDAYNHPNEPCHHIPYLFVYCARPWLTQKWVARIREHAYGTGPYGLCGNDDVGQMSAWYVMSALGLHPVNPAGGVYVLTSPLFPKATLRLDPKYYPGGSFTITAENVSQENVYVQSASLNGRPLDRAWITHAEIAKGGTLSFVLGPEPNEKWGLVPPPLRARYPSL